jgi:hypothetical protein
MGLGFNTFELLSLVVIDFTFLVKLTDDNEALS